jgi:hypothetical protein
MHAKRVLLGLCLCAPAFSQNNEVGLTLGGLLSRDRGTLEIGGGTSWQANYGRRIYNGESCALFAEVHFLANPLREIASSDSRATRDVATLFVTPGLRLKLLTGRRVHPYVAAGGGYALYENSTTTLGGAPNPAPRFDHTGAFMFGGGVDMPVWRWFGVRLEVRDFYTRNPVFNIPVSGGRQHNIVAGGGFSLTF